MKNYSPKIKSFESSIAILTSQISVFILICHNLPKAIQKARKKQRIRHFGVLDGYCGDFELRPELRWGQNGGERDAEWA